MSKKARIAGPGLIVNRHAKNSKIEIAFDPSPEGFVSAARRENARLKLIVIPGKGEIEPIEITVSPKIWVFKFERAQIPAERLADLEALITEEQDVHCVLEYTPSQDELTFEPDPPAALRNYTDAEDAEVNAVNKVNEVPIPNSADSPVSEDPTDPEILEFKPSNVNHAGVTIALHDDGKLWRAVYVWHLGNYQGQSLPLENADRHPSRDECLDETKVEILLALRGVEVTGNADAKRSAKVRLGRMAEQFERWADAQVTAGKAVPFEEDQPRDSGEPAEDAEDDGE